ncbi:uncharacterized protein LOC108138459 [Drosophila elegans]|uniref:uncharacterized protein LOC108138459 n=1 Tax=Drosophila elegans TaxID=30023 RepID=UPI0007E6437A|nr:uncharacterized protein LOC108138459 [Drosophila elegans]
MGIFDDFHNYMTRVLCFSSDPDGNFEGLTGIGNKIALRVYEVMDRVLNREEMQYHTNLVIGLAVLSVAVCGLTIYILMRWQRAPLLSNICQGGPRANLPTLRVTGFTRFGLNDRN